MKTSFLIVSLATLALTILKILVKAEISPDIHSQCKSARDYLVCVKAFTSLSENQTDATRVEIDQTNRPGLLAEVGNQCPIGYGYAGGGRCHSVVCKGLSIFGRNEPELGGKGHACSGGARALNQGIFFGRGTLTWGNDYVKASYNAKCPKREMKIGDLTTCSLSSLQNETLHNALDEESEEDI